MSQQEGRPGDAAFGWLRSFLRPHWVGILLVLALSLIGTGVSLSQPYITKFLIDDGLIAGNMKVVVWLCGLLVVVAVFSAAVNGVNRWHYTRLSGRVLFAIRETVYAHLQRLSPAWYARRPGGDMMARVDGDVAEIQRFAVDSLLAAVNAAFGLAGALALMLTLSPELSVMAFILLPLQFLYLRNMRPLVERRTRALRERSGEVTGFFFDNLRIMKFIQSMSGEAREAERLGHLNKLYLGDTLKLQMANFWTATGPALMTVVATALVFVVGGFMVLEQRFTIGALIAFSAYMARATGPVNTLLGLYVAIQRARVSLVRVRELTLATPEVSSPGQPRNLPGGAKGTIDIKAVKFSYGADGPAVLDGASLEIEGGAKVGVVGASGAGKTTLIDLLHRHFDPDSGSIQLDGVELAELELAELRRRVAVVAQDAAIIPGTVADNIAYGRPGTPRERIEAAARAARIDDEVRAMDKGYDTQLVAGGDALSGGQRQRLAIARAILQDPLVLILDEATAAVDRTTASRIVETVDDLFGGRTRIVISHHPEPLAGADMIVEIRNGELHVFDS